MLQLTRNKPPPRRNFPKSTSYQPPQPSLLKEGATSALPTFLPRFPADWFPEVTCSFHVNMPHWHLSALAPEHPPCTWGSQFSSSHSLRLSSRLGRGPVTTSPWGDPRPGQQHRAQVVRLEKHEMDTYPAGGRQGKKRSWATKGRVGMLQTEEHLPTNSANEIHGRSHRVLQSHGRWRSVFEERLPQGGDTQTKSWGTLSIC